MNGTIKLQCVGCKNKRDITLEEAYSITDQPFCAVCGMPEVVIAAKANSRRSGADLRKVFQ